MSRIACQICKETGLVCSTCGVSRREFRPPYGDRLHINCARRPKGIQVCPNHVATHYLCDFCGAVRAECSGEFVDPGPTAVVRANNFHACTACFAKLAVAHDSALSGGEVPLTVQAAASVVRILERVSGASRPTDLTNCSALVSACRRFLARDAERKKRDAA